MKDRYEFILHSFIVVVTVGLAVCLAQNTLGNLGKPSPEVVDPMQLMMAPAEARAPVSASMMIFEKRDIFAPIVTAKPTLTPVVVPTPTPEPPVVADWDVILIIGHCAQIRDSQGKMYYLKEGDSLENVKLVEVSWEHKTIHVRSQADGREQSLKMETGAVGGNSKQRRAR